MFYSRNSDPVFLSPQYFVLSQFAGIEFPGISSSSPIIAKRKQKLLSCFESHFFSFQPSESERMPISGIDKQILELFKGAKAASEKEAIVDSSSRFTVALLFALSTSIAVLNNTYSHFKHLLDTELDEMECKEKNEALQMIHYQFTKIYDIEQGCHSMERLFRSLGSRSHSGTQKGSKKTKKRKLNRASLAAEKTVRHIFQVVFLCCEGSSLIEFYVLSFEEYSNQSRNGRS